MAKHITIARKYSILRDVTAEIDSKSDILRVILCHKYNLNFPTVEETAETTQRRKTRAASALGRETNPRKHRAKRQVTPPDDEDDDSSSDFRTWTDKSGKFQIRAKYAGMDGDKVKLEKRDGTILRIPLSRLSEADQRFIKETEEKAEEE